MQKQPNAAAELLSEEVTAKAPPSVFPKKKRSSEDAMLVETLKAHVIVVFFASSVETSFSWSAFPFLQGGTTLCMGPGGVILFSSPVSPRSRRVPR